MPTVELPSAEVRVLEPGEEPHDWFVGVDGPRPGVEAISIVPFVAVLLLLDSLVLAVAVVAVAFALVAASRRFLTVVRTDRGFLLVHGGQRRVALPDANVERLPSSTSLVMTDSGDTSVQLGGRRLWLYPADRDVAYRIAHESTSK